MKPATIDVDLKPYIVAEVGGTVVKGEFGKPEFRPDSPGRYETVLGRCTDQHVYVRVLRQKIRRTPKQNSYLWGVVYVDILKGLRELAESVGELPVFTDEDELHEAMKWAFLRKVYVLPGAGTLEALPHSSKLSIAEFGEFVDKIKRWAGERRIWVREPNEVAA